jgi:RimJ/RimL family protein N-acetyltransferase
LCLKRITPSDITPQYEAWLNNPEVTRFLEIRFQRQSRPEMERYLKDKLSNHRTSKHFGIFDEGGTRLIGTVTAPKINIFHRSADISYVIGYPGVTGKHYATESVHAISHYLIYECGVERLWAGYYDGHVASAKVLAANGFRVEARLRQHYIGVDGKRVDGIIVGLLAHEFRPEERWLGKLPALKRLAA